MKWVWFSLTLLGTLIPWFIGMMAIGDRVSRWAESRLERWVSEDAAK